MMFFSPSLADQDVKYLHPGLPPAAHATRYHGIQHVCPRNLPYCEGNASHHAPKRRRRTLVKLLRPHDRQISVLTLTGDCPLAHCRERRVNGRNLGHGGRCPRGSKLGRRSGPARRRIIQTIVLFRGTAVFWSIHSLRVVLELRLARRQPCASSKASLLQSTTRVISETSPN